MLRLLIPIDGSDHARRAIDAAAKLAKDVAVECVLLHVREGHVYHGDVGMRDYDRIEHDAHDRQDALLEDALAHARRVGLERTSTQGIEGTPDTDIPRVAEEIEADIIVMGTRGLGAVGALLLGSVTQRVVHNTHVPVLLVK